MRRKYRRYNLQCPVHVRFSVGQSVSELYARSKNVSLGGMMLEADVPIPQNCPVLLNMTLEGELIARPLHVIAEGTVVRVVESGQRFAIAIECNRPIAEIERLF
jgi:hypothetical protein